MYKCVWFILSVLLISCATKQPDKEYSFYSSSNYYFDTAKNKNFKIDSSYFSKVNFILIDEADFLNHKNYSYYFIFKKRLHFWGTDLIYSLKHPLNTNEYIASYSFVSYNGSKVVPRDILPEQKLTQIFDARKKIYALNKDTASLIRDKVSAIINNIHLYDNSDNSIIRENSIEMFCYQDGKYYFINKGFSSDSTIWRFNDFLLDTLLKTEFVE